VVNFPTLHAAVGGFLRAGERPAGVFGDLDGLLGGAVVSDLGEGDIEDIVADRSGVGEGVVLVGADAFDVSAEVADRRAVGVDDGAGCVGLLSVSSHRGSTSEEQFDAMARQGCSRSWCS
jgi:hypothetical protein